MGKKSSNHVHKYRRVIHESGWTIYRCMLPGCPHFLPTIGLLPGRSSICWECEKEFTLDHSHTRVAKPICLTCKVEKDNPTKTAPTASLSDVMKLLGEEQ